LARFGSVVVDVGRLRQHREFRLLTIGSLVGGLGRQVTIISLPYQLYVITHSALAIGALAIVQLVPLLTFSMIGGTIADTVERRRLLLITQTGLMACSGALALIATAAAPPIVLIYGVAFVAGAISAVDQPARSSAMYRVVPREELPWAISISQVTWNVSSVLGPALGGALIAIAGLPAAYGIDALTFAVSIAAILAIAPMPPLGGATRFSIAAIVEGLRYARQTRVLLATFVVDLDAMIFGMPIALFPILSLDVFHAGPEGVGLMAAAPAAGALLGAVFTGWVHRVRLQGRAVIVAVAVWGLAIAAFGLSTFSFPLALLFLAIAGGADMFSAIFRSTILQVGLPDHLRGRLSALHLTVVTGGPRLGDLEATAVAAAVNAPFSVVSGGLLCVLGLAAVVWWYPELVAYDAHRAAAAAAELSRVEAATG
jgi:MFS family permease